jgi:arginyl-tRNA--protein-N-Asp/Glu arginylyltransferase
MEVIKTTKKGPILYTIEKYHIYKAYQIGIQVNDTHTNKKNPIFEILYRYQQVEYQCKNSHYTSHQQPHTNTQ